MRPNHYIGNYVVFISYWGTLMSDRVIAIVTTIGFGDVAATSIEGRIISVILGVYGIIVVALIISIIVNFYGEMKKKDARGD